MMSGNNYKAWEIKVEDFWKCKTNSEKIQFLLNFAVLAPSSHNSQPWKFAIKEDKILIYIESSRRLQDSDQNDRQLYISLGCAITNIIAAASYYCWKTEVEYFPLKSDILLAAQLTINSSSKLLEESRSIISSILNRSNNRNKYENRLPPKSFLKKIESFSSESLKVILIQQKEKKDELANVVLKAGEVAMDDNKFRKELSKYIKVNTTRSFIGMPAFGMGIPTPISFFAPIMIRYLNMNRMSHKKDEAILKQHTPIFGIIVAQKDERRAWIKTGELYEKIALLAEGEGLKTAVSAAAIQIGNFYKDLQKILQTDYRPQILFRLGYTNKKTRHSPRLLANDVLG